MDFLRVIFLFVVGLCVGSFLNVVADRLPKRESVFGGRSYCDHCRKKLAWCDLIPLLSFVWLKGKCRYCGEKISWQYPAVELGTGIVFAIGGIRLIGEIGGIREMGEFLFFLFISSALVAVFVSDLKYQIIPDQVVYPAIALGLFYNFMFHVSCFMFRLLSGLLAAGFFFLLYLVTRRRGMGLGDVKLVFLMGLLLGWPKIVIALYFAFLTGALVGVILILTGKKKFGQHIPFGPFLVTGTFVAWFLGEKILGYLSYLGYL